ncbi:MAG: hypothetical protein M1830_009567 [Pleopsidium flavum]|nr:MAG: hypothetical protein M1830_009567 [Pleopsidium flavum]
MEPVGLIGLGLAVFSTADLCINKRSLFRYGNLLVSKCRAYRDAEREISELILCVEDHWVKLEIQIGILRTVWHELRGNLQVHQNRVLQLLQLKLQEATVLIDGAIGKPDNQVSINSVIRKKGRLHKGTFALSLKECLEKTIKDLERWHNIFDPSWFLITRISSWNIDQQLTDERASKSDLVSTLRSLRDELRTDLNSVGNKPSIFISTVHFLAERRPIPFSPSQFSQERENGRDVIVDTILCNPLDQIAKTTKDIRDLARVLSKTDPLTFGLLACRGVIQVMDSAKNVTNFELVYTVPEGLKSPRSLRSLLLASDRLYPLNERIDLAKQLAKSVMFVHTSQFVHKNIRPETIVVFKNENSVLGAPFLVGFEKVRSAEGVTYRLGDSEWQKNLYRHPKRQGTQPEEDYKMQHDIYSLGVCLLELGLWSSFAQYSNEVDPPTTGPALNIAEQLSMKDQRKKAFEIKRILVDMAKDRLPSRIGKKYTEIVVSCLTCLDKENNGFGDESDFVDEDGISVGVRYIEKVGMLIPHLYYADKLRFCCKLRRFPFEQQLMMCNPRVLPLRVETWFRRPLVLAYGKPLENVDKRRALPPPSVELGVKRSISFKCDMRSEDYWNCLK